MSRRALAGAALAAVLGWATSASAGTAGAAGAHRHGTRTGAQAFLLTSSPDSLADLRAHAGSISVLYPTDFECTPGGSGVAGADIPAIDSFAHSRAITVMPRFNCQDGAVVHRLLSEPGPRQELLARLAALARKPAFAGLCLDLENDGPVDRGALSSFVAALAQKLHRHHRRLAAVVDGVTREGPGAPYAFYDDRALSASADTVFVMAWGTHWAGSAPGSISTLSFVSGVVGFLSTLPERSRFVIGAPMYGLDWAATGVNGQPLSSQSTQLASAFQYPRALELARSVKAHVIRDPLSGELSFSYTGAGGVTHDVWYMDAQSILDVLRIARHAGFQVGLWRLGSEDQSLWSSSLLRT